MTNSNLHSISHSLAAVTRNGFQGHSKSMISI